MMAKFEFLTTHLRLPDATKLFSLFAGCCSIFGLFLVLYPYIFPDIFPGNNQQEFQRRLTDYFLILLIVILLGYTLYFHWRRQYVYSISGIYFHHVSHIMRDFLGKLQRDFNGNAISSGIEYDLKSIIEECLDAISELFTALSGAKCNASYKELNLQIDRYEDYELVTYARDKYSAKKRMHIDKKPIKHRLFDNTDFYNLFFGIQNNNRHYYFCNNLPDEWRKGDYKNSSFQACGEPKHSKFLFWHLQWSLEYKSTIVFPLRYIPTYVPPRPEDKIVDENWKYWGFLCIDCNRKKIFDIRHQGDLGAAFADMLYTFISQAALIINAQTSKINERKEHGKEQSKGSDKENEKNKQSQASG